MKYLATCKLGLESVVARELRELGIAVDETADARVFFSGGYAVMIRALLWLRAAERVLLIVGSFEAERFDALFDGTYALNWKAFLRPDTTIHVTGKSAKSPLFSVPDCQRIVKKAIVENLKQAYHCTVIPEGGPEVIVEVGMLRGEATLALDCCGAGLSRRGYRTYNVSAPISETLGAAVIMLARYKADMPLLDPLCGSGTMPIEAAMIAANIAPGNKREFAAEQWDFVDAHLWAEQREAAGAAERAPSQLIRGYDIDPHCIDLCKKHAKKAGVMLSWGCQPVSALQSEHPSGIIVCNPPYGERVFTKETASALYRQMREVFDAMPGWSKHIVSGMRDFERAYGRHADKRRNLSNGGIPCVLYQYFAERAAGTDT